MAFERTFSEIFSEIHGSQPDSESFNPGWESHLEPAGLAQLLGELSVIAGGAKSFPKAYAAFKPRPVARKPHQMTGPQADAFMEFKRHSPHLPEGFSARELKSAYRQCALKTHPDRGGDSETFQLVKKSYHILEALVKNEA